MRLLLDTQVWLWMQVAPERFSARTRRILTSPETELFFSAVSTWEIVIKASVGKLPLPLPADDYVTTRLEGSGITALPIDVTHALRVVQLPVHHRDPFDRLLIAQAQIEGLPVLSADRQFRRYDIKLVPV